MRYLLDTSICLTILKGESVTALERLEQLESDEVVTSAIVAAELLIGAARRDALEIAGSFLARVNPLAFDQKAAKRYAMLPFKRASFDRLIAAHALSRDLTLITANEKDFRVPGLRIENWASE